MIGSPFSSVTIPVNSLFLWPGCFFFMAIVFPVRMNSRFLGGRSQLSNVSTFGNSLTNVISFGDSISSSMYENLTVVLASMSVRTSFSEAFFADRDTLLP